MKPPHAQHPRLFVGLWPAPAQRRELVAYGEQWGWPLRARLVSPDDLHVTLHFLGGVLCEQLPDLDAALAAVRSACVRLEFGQPEVWPGGIAIVHILPNQALTDLHRLVGIQLRQLGISLDSRPYSPHVTLARNAHGATPPARGLRLVHDAGAMVLAESVAMPTPHYAHLRVYPLA
jgi:2'-5' RNA ligase